MQCRSFDEARDALHLPLALERAVLNGLSRKQLAKVARVEEGMLWRWEQGMRAPKGKLAVVADAILGIVGFPVASERR